MVNRQLLYQKTASFLQAKNYKLLVSQQLSKNHDHPAGPEPNKNIPKGQTAYSKAKELSSFKKVIPAKGHEVHFAVTFVLS